MDELAVNSPNAVEYRLEPYLFKEDSDGRLHGSNKYRRYLLGDDIPGELPIKLGKRYLHDEQDPLSLPLWRFFDYSEPSQTERWEIFNSLNPTVQSLVLRLLADVRDPNAGSYEYDTRLKAIHMEGTPDALAGLIFAGLETRYDTPAASQANTQILGRTVMMFASFIIMSRHGYRNWKKLLLPLLVRRYLCYPFDVPNPMPGDRRFLESMYASIPNSVFMCNSFAGGLLRQLTRMGVLSPSPPVQWAFLAQFHSISAPRARRRLKELEQQGILKPTIADLGDPLNRWVDAAIRLAPPSQAFPPA